jgi:hypothetical protein
VASCEIQRLFFRVLFELPDLAITIRTAVFGNKNLPNTAIMILEKLQLSINITFNRFGTKPAISNGVSNGCQSGKRFQHQA